MDGSIEINDADDDGDGQSEAEEFTKHTRRHALTRARANSLKIGTVR